MAQAGFVCLIIALVAAAASVVALLAGEVLARKERTGARGAAVEAAGRSAQAARIGRGGVLLSALMLLVCCGILVFCFMTGDTSIEYVLEERSLSSSGLAWLYKLSGLWAGRQGSLLFWAFLISLYAVAVWARHRKSNDRMDNMALLVMQAVLTAFLGVLVFSGNNMPFEPTPSNYFTSTGELTDAASLLGMNQLLEHWAMAIHPPTLFIGYAGMTVPFAYALAALIVGDASKKWVERATRFTLFAWIFLGIGIGLGCAWAYVVLGWGGYWGWDPVENASLLSWLVGVALIHTFTVYRQRGAFKRWGIMCACLAFAFVIVGTFISRSGIVQSVHAFSGDPVSLGLFGGLIIASVAAGIVGLAIRWKSFGPEVEGGDDVENMLSKEGAYYFNNVIMIVFTFLLTYMTVCSALPSWLPFGGDSLSSASYDAIAHPLGIFYLLILAVCPLLAWGKTDRSKFLKQARIPFVCALVLFVLLMVYFATVLAPAYDATIAAGGSSAQSLSEEGPRAYYFGLTVAGFFVASLLFFNALFMLGRGVARYRDAHQANVAASFVGLFRTHASTYGGTIAHIAMSIILVGLICSSMYVTEKTAYVPYDSDTNTASEDFTIENYTLKFTNASVEQANQGTAAVYETDFDVYKNSAYVGAVSPQVQVAMATQQQKLNASVLGFPSEDLFVVYRGVNSQGALSLDVRVNRGISLVWGGFFLLMVGAALALVGGRGPKPGQKAQRAGANGKAEAGAGSRAVSDSGQKAQE